MPQGQLRTRSGDVALSHRCIGPLLIGPKTARVIDNLAAAFFQRHRFEHIMVDQNDQYVTGCKRIIKLDKFGAASCKFHRQSARIGLDNLDAFAELAR